MQLKYLGKQECKKKVVNEYIFYTFANLEKIFNKKKQK